MEKAGTFTVKKLSLFLEELAPIFNNDSKIRSFIEEVFDYVKFLHTAQLVDAADFKSDLYRKIRQSSNQIVIDGGKALEGINDKKIKANLMYLFRRIVGNVVYSSEIMKRALEKPKGYPGDYQMLEFIYDNEIVSKGEGAYFDRYFLDDELAAAVRCRKNEMARMLKSYIKKGFRLLNLACGSCREIRESSQFLSNTEGVKFVCVDQDDEALTFSEGQLQKVTNVAFEFSKKNILRLFNEKQRAEKFDIVYSIGLADYLPDKIIIRMFQYAERVLRQGGRFIIAHKDYSSYLPLPANWFCDWHFIPRLQDEFCGLIKGCQFKVEFLREKTGIIYFLVCEKL